MTNEFGDTVIHTFLGIFIHHFRGSSTKIGKRPDKYRLRLS